MDSKASPLVTWDGDVIGTPGHLCHQIGNFPCFTRNVGEASWHLDFVLSCEYTVVKNTKATMEFGASALPTITIYPSVQRISS